MKWEFRGDFRQSPPLHAHTPTLLNRQRDLAKHELKHDRSTIHSHTPDCKKFVYLFQFISWLSNRVVSISLISCIHSLNRSLSSACQAMVFGRLGDGEERKFTKRNYDTSFFKPLHKTLSWLMTNFLCVFKSCFTGHQLSLLLGICFQRCCENSYRPVTE